MAIGTTNLDHPHDHVCPPEGTMNAVVNAGANIVPMLRYGQLQFHRAVLRCD
jgi:hypothetical protein